MAKNAACVDKQLAEAVRGFPILYNKTLKEFRDRTKGDHAWWMLGNPLGLVQVSYWISSFIYLIFRYKVAISVDEFDFILKFFTKGKNFF